MNESPSVVNRFSRAAKWTTLLTTIALILFAGIWITAATLVGPNQHPVGAPPADMRAEAIVITKATAEPVHGWFVPGVSGRGVIVLLHGVRADRRAMIDRATFLHDAGYAVVLIDFQAAGESPGKAITFGLREADDVKATLRYVHQRMPGERTGIIGTSMGGAATLLAEPDVDVNALVLEQVYPTIRQAVEDRLAIRLGPMGKPLAPILLAGLHPLLGISPDQLRPIDHIGRLSMPKLLIVGDRDQHTTINESYAMYAAAREPKALWVVPGAQHVDLYAHEGAAYRSHVLAFFRQWVRHEPER